MKILFVHQNFPGQYKHLAPALARLGHEVRALTMSAQPSTQGVLVHRYGAQRASSKTVHPWVTDFEAKVIRGEACARAAESLRQQGYTPDLICVHPGWGESLLLREVWPLARQWHFVEFFYGAEGRDVGFDPEFPAVDFDARCRLSIKNTNNLLNLGLMDAGISPTHWQRSTVPAEFQGRIEVCHDGVDTRQLVPQADARLQLTDLDGQSVSLSRADPVLTFVNRNLEPCRGYHVFMRALPRILAACPRARVLIIGGDGVSYGAAPPGGSHKQVYLDEMAGQIDRSRVHFLGRVPYGTYLQVMRVSRAHVYLTYPFVLSWSMLEAMSLGAVLIASATSPVLEVVQDGVNGRLVDFFDIPGLARRAIECLDRPADFEPMRRAARQTVVERYDLHQVCLPRQLALVEALLAQGPRKSA